MAVKNTLPDVDAFSTDLVLHALATTLFSDTQGNSHVVAHQAGFALAYIRAWRKSLPHQGLRSSDYPYHLPDRKLLLLAVRHITFADTVEPNLNPESAHLRSAEALLRTLIKRHREKDPCCPRHKVITNARLVGVSVDDDGLGTIDVIEDTLGDAPEWTI